MELKDLTKLLEKADKCEMPKRLCIPELEKARQAFFSVQKRDEMYSEILIFSQGPDLLKCFSKFQSRLEKLEKKSALFFFALIFNFGTTQYSIEYSSKYNSVICEKQKLKTL